MSPFLKGTLKGLAMMGPVMGFAAGTVCYSVKDIPSLHPWGWIVFGLFAIYAYLHADYIQHNVKT